MKPWQVWDNNNGQLRARPADLFAQLPGHPDADAVADIGNGLLASAAVRRLEAHLGLPVVTSNQRDCGGRCGPTP